MIDADKKKILGMLFDGGYLSESQIMMLQRFMGRWNTSGFHAILATEVLSEGEIADALAKLMRIDRVYHVKALPVRPETLSKLRYRQARQWECLPAGEIEGFSGKFEVILADPTRQDRINLLKQELGYELTLAVAERSDIVRAVDELYPLEDQLPGHFKD